MEKGPSNNARLRRMKGVIPLNKSPLSAKTRQRILAKSKAHQAKWDEWAKKEAEIFEETEGE